MKYKYILATHAGGPEVLQVMETDLRAPARGEVRIKVLASAVCRPDITVRSGKALYSGTPLGQKFPFVPGYAAVGIVDAIGAGVTRVSVGQNVGALTVIGGYSEYLYWKSDRLIQMPTGLDPAESVTLILNYIVAYQCMHRSARVKPGEKVLMIGASGGIGSSFLQLGQLAGLKMYGLASPEKHTLLQAYGAQAIDYHTQDFVSVMREAEPSGINVVFDGLMRPQTVNGALSLLCPAGRLISYGEPAGFGDLSRVLSRMTAVNLFSAEKSCRLYGTSFYFLGKQQPFLEDWQKLFQLLQTRQIQPLITQKFSLSDAAAAHRLLESGSVCGNLVLLASELL
ncbi:MAG: zinc-binding dehydrogenase [Anaerolineae bacterium]|nr:zinc-binding dehydrogenase [Anaerolineae bacterium]